MLHVHLGEMVSQPLHTIYVQVRITARIYHPWTCPHTCSNENADWSNKKRFFFVYVQNISSETWWGLKRQIYACKGPKVVGTRQIRPKKFMSTNPRLINCNSLPDSFITLALALQGLLVGIYYSKSQILICQKWISVWPYEQSQALRGHICF